MIGEIAPKQIPTEAECICPKEVAARLIHLLMGGDEPLAVETAPEQNRIWTSVKCSEAAN